MAVTKPLASDTIVLGAPPEPGDNTAKVATMEAVQDLVTERISSAFIYQGSTDCSTNPNYPAASAGHLYRVSVAGKIGGASGVPAGAGDFFVALEDNAGGTEAAVGTFWEVWEGNLQPGVDYNSYRAEVDKINALGDSVASDSASDIATASGDFITVSGNDPISSLGTADAGVERVLVFASTPTLTHNATSLILPAGANITCAAGDVAVMRSLGSGNWRCIDFVRASGEALTVSATSVGAAVHGATGKTTPVDADTVPLIDSAAGNVLKKLTWANIKATLKTYFDTLYAAVSHTHALASISHSGATTGQVPEWSGSAWVPATPSGGGGPDVQIFTASGTWSNPSPATPRPVRVLLVSGGTGGASGRKGVAGVARSGGGGGGGGCAFETLLSSDFLGATEAVVVGAGGAGGAAVSVNSTNGNPGNPGGLSSFANCTAPSPNASSGGNASNGTGSAAKASSFYLYGFTSAGASVAGATGRATSVGDSATPGILTGIVGQPTGGGGGGGFTGLNVPSDGGAGAGSSSNNFTGAVSGAVGGVAPGGQGANGPTRFRLIGGLGGGGGAGGGGNGGDGSFPGGGGGGGGAGTDDAEDSGAGGNGGNGVVIIITY